MGSPKPHAKSISYSIFHLGTRYKRRGIDLDGYVANYVETEQIIEVAGDHIVSFVQTRGSIPVYWSQPGYVN